MQARNFIRFHCYGLSIYVVSLLTPKQRKSVHGITNISLKYIRRKNIFLKKCSFDFNVCTWLSGDFSNRSIKSVLLLLEIYSYIVLIDLDIIQLIIIILDPISYMLFKH